MQGVQGAATAAGSRAGSEEGARTAAPALHALCALARTHRIAAHPATLAHQLGCSPSKGADIDLLLRAARHLAARKRAEIKLKTFPFTRQGTVGAAAVRTVTADAVNDEKCGAILPVTPALER
jgi:hypothetical protein